jgi:ABC-2 type transport system permease protein
MLNLYLKELKRNRRHFIIWILIVCFFTFFIMSFYPSFAAKGSKMDEMMKSMPEGMTKAFGMAGGFMSDFLTYYKTYYGLHIMILTGIFAISLSGGLIAKEEGIGTADFLLTKPLWRHQIVTAKLLALFSYMLVFLGVQILLSIVSMSLFVDTEVSTQKFAVLNIYGFLLTYFFAGVGFLLSAVSKRGRSVTGLVVGLVVGSFIVQALSRISESTEWLGWISPFQYADFDVGQADYGLEVWRVLVLAGIGTACFVFTYLVYSRKDIHS